MVVDVRKLSNGTGLARSVYQHGHFCVRTFHLLISYPCYSLFIFFIIYLQIMDFILYHKIRARGPLDLSSLNQTNTPKVSQTIHIFDTLSIKKLMVEPIIHYVRSPLAEIIEKKLHFTYYFPFISANAISYFHSFLSLICLKFLSSESLIRRQIGVIIFQFRIFLDAFDGVVFRAHSNNKRYKSYYGDWGYYIDAISDVLGGTCLVIGCIFYFNKQRPFRSIRMRSNIFSSSSINDGENEEINLEDNQSSSTINEINNNLFETKERIILTLVLFSVRYSLSAIFWDRNVHAYEDLLDSKSNTLQKQTLQLNILHSPLTILIFYLWRYLCALSIQDYLLFAIFIDRTWEFIKKTSRIHWCILLLTICLTELHVDQIRSLFAALSTI